MFDIHYLDSLIFEDDKIIYEEDFICPITLAMLSMYKCIGKDVWIENETVSNYAENMNYDNPSEIFVDKDKHIKVMKLSDKNISNQSTNITNILSNNGYLDKDSIKTLELILEEIFDNFYAHANSKYPSLFCLQSHNNKYLELALVDAGIGIEKSLGKIMDEHNGENPCKVACMTGVSGKLKQYELGEIADKPNHSGYGLFYTKTFIEENNGKFYLISGNNCYGIEKNQEVEKKLNFNWNGTAIRLLINKNNSINAETFYKEVAIKQGVDADDFF